MSIYDNLEFRLLKYIVAVAEEGSVTKAAARLHVAQSAVSTQIASVEEVFKIQIFVRMRNGVILTAVGEAILPTARRFLKEREDLVKAAQTLQRAGSGPFKLSFTPFVESEVVGLICRSYRWLFPKVEIRADSADIEEILEQLAQASIDSALVTLPFESDGLCVHPVISEPMVVCLRKDDPLAAFDELPPKSLDGKLCIFSNPQRHPLAHARLLEMLQREGITPRLGNPNLGTGHIHWMVKERQCLALIRQGESLGEDLTTRPIQGVRWTIDFALVYRPEQEQMTLPLLFRELERRVTKLIPVPDKKSPHSAAGADTRQQLLFGEPEHRLKESA
jgi:DNA-binding transcriptional LysR family regulator